MSIRDSVLISVLCVGLISCGKKDEEEGVSCADEISSSENSFAAEYAEYYCDLRDQCLETLGYANDESVDDCKKRTSRGQLDRACNECTLDGDKIEQCLEAAKTTGCEDWEESWGTDEKKPVKACDHVWVGCSGDGWISIEKSAQAHSERCQNA